MIFSCSLSPQFSQYYARGRRARSDPAASRRAGPGEVAGCCPRRGPVGRGGLRSTGRGRSAVQISGQLGHRWIVEYERRGQPEAGGFGKPVPQFHTTQRVEAHIVEPLVGPDIARRRVTEDRCGVLENQVGNGLLSFGFRYPVQGETA